MCDDTRDQNCENTEALVVPARERFRSSCVRFRAGALVGWDGCEVRLCDQCARVRPCAPCVCVPCPGSPGVFSQV